MTASAHRNAPEFDIDSPKAGQVALKFFFNLMDKWHCSVEEQMVLLGSIGRSTLYKYRQLPEVRLPRDTMERVSYLMGIHKSLRILFGDKPSTYEWVRKANSEAPFNGNSALELMLAGGVVDLADVRRYLDGVRGLRQTLPAWLRAYRLVSSAFPPISVFEDVLDAADLEQAFLIEGLTNDRLREEAGLLAHVAPEDRVSGPGSSPLMAAFTHVGAISRFTAGQYGVYYCGDSLHTAVAETRYHRERFLRATREPSLELTLRAYVCRVVKALDDIRQDHEHLHDPDPAAYPIAQRFAAERRKQGSWGLLYRSVRHPAGECAALFRPPAASIPHQGVHLRYVWDGKLQRITEVFTLKTIA